jgi:hypothetical protein
MVPLHSFWKLNLTPSSIVVSTGAGPIPVQQERNDTQGKLVKLLYCQGDEIAAR